MSSFLKHVDPETGKLVEDAHHDSNAADDVPSPAEARARVERLVSAELQRMEDAFTIQLKEANDRAAAAQGALASLQKEHDELVSRHAEAQRKLEILHELKERLSAV